MVPYHQNFHKIKHSYLLKLQLQSHNWDATFGQRYKNNKINRLLSTKNVVYYTSLYFSVQVSTIGLGFSAGRKGQCKDSNNLPKKGHLIFQSIQLLCCSKQAKVFYRFQFAFAVPVQSLRYCRASQVALGACAQATEVSVNYRNYIENCSQCEKLLILA